MNSTADTAAAPLNAAHRRSLMGGDDTASKVKAVRQIAEKLQCRPPA